MSKKNGGDQNHKPGRKPAPGQLVPGSNGGKLAPGNWGQAVGWGRPPMVLREQLRQSFAARIPVLEAIADGAPVRKTRVLLRSIFRHARCPKCEGPLELTATAAEDPYLEVSALDSATPRERTLAIETMGKFGLGPLKALSADDVRGKLAETIRLVRETLPEADADALLARLAPVWR